MRSHMIRVGLGLMVVGTSSSVVTLQQSSKENSFLSSLGIVRFGRAAFAVALVTADYKFTLQGISPECEEYQHLISKVLEITSPLLVDKHQLLLDVFTTYTGWYELWCFWYHQLSGGSIELLNAAW